MKRESIRKKKKSVFDQPVILALENHFWADKWSQMDFSFLHLSGKMGIIVRRCNMLYPPPPSRTGIIGIIICIHS